MANNYLQFSEVLTFETDLEKDWLNAALNDGAFSFSSEFTNEHELWIYSEECADPEEVALFVQAFLRHFGHTDYWTLTWAESCSKPRIGEFSGGALFVTKDKICFSSPWDEIQRLVESHHGIST